ncbi:NERD domain-containing protein [Aphanothece sacrum]|uniref:NERD domain protein n=1 Tax=Aphanothece sacrum FPU1 TaxID=1920663 RepID=A0A401IBX7_APHSA|nr:NERD domain-containing protein [Aphanothece sacrum]GBF78742.1 NERD domain protein [Aphanothece sacrum FPU1]GBF82974.1 hypothetical protein AsFPU3_0011 [Aphanothece sacrum FPU3]
MSKTLSNLFHDSDITDKAQNRLYSLFKKQLPDDFTIFSSVKWTVNHSNSGQQKTDADLVIISPQFNTVVLKIREGDISYDQGNWYNNNNLIPDPFQQAIETKYSLLQYLQEHDFWSDKPIVISEAVAFPDVSINNAFGLDIPQTLILDQPQLFNLRNWLKSVMSYSENQQQIEFALSQENKKQNINYDQQQSFPISVVSQISMTQNSKSLMELSPEQLELLEFLKYHNRVAINSCSDSEKTLLIIEQVNRLHQKKLSILVISYKRSSTKYIRHQLGEREDLQINDFYELSKSIIKKAINHDINLKKYPNKKLLFDEILPTLLLKSIAKIDLSFDAIIVTQGHKINKLWWLALKELLKDPEQGYFYLFYNTSQKTVQKHWYPPLEEAPYCLLNHWDNYQINCL